MDATNSILERIFSTADRLYDALDKQAFPTVDAVRKHAKVNMNDACTGMKEWRRRQRSQPANQQVIVPTPLIEAATVSLQSLWIEATSAANAALVEARACWQLERDVLETMNTQISAAYESMSTELEASRTAIANLQAQLDQSNMTIKASHRQIDQLMHANVVATAACDQAAAVKAEVEIRAADLRRELEQAYAALARANNDAAEVRRTSAHELALSRQSVEDLRHQLSAQYTAIQSQLAKA